MSVKIWKTRTFRSKDGESVFHYKLQVWPKMSALISHLIDCFIWNQIIPRYLITLSKARWCGGHFKDSLSRGADTRACNLSVLTLYHPSWNGLPQIKKYNCFFINWPIIFFTLIYSCTKQTSTFILLLPKTINYHNKNWLYWLQNY